MSNRRVWVVEWDHYMGICGLAALFTTEDAAQAYARQREIDEDGPNPINGESSISWRVYEDVVHRTSASAIKADKEGADAT